MKKHKSADKQKNKRKLFISKQKKEKMSFNFSFLVTQTIDKNHMMAQESCIST